MASPIHQLTASIIGLTRSALSLRLFFDLRGHLPSLDGVEYYPPEFCSRTRPVRHQDTLTALFHSSADSYRSYGHELTSCNRIQSRRSERISVWIATMRFTKSTLFQVLFVLQSYIMCRVCDIFGANWLRTIAFGFPSPTRLASMVHSALLGCHWTSITRSV